MADPSSYHSLLRDETRRKIIELLGQQERVGFKEFRDTLKVGVGTLYYHLDILSDYVTQDKSRKYMLNDRGRLLHQAMTEGSIPTALRLDRVYQNRALRWLFLSPVLGRMNSPAKWLPVSTLVFLLGAIGTGFARLDPVLLFYTPTTRGFELVAASFLFYWTGAFFFMDILAYLIYKRAGEDVHLLVCMGTAAIPLAIYPYIHMAISSATTSMTVVYLLRGVLLVLQVWSVILLTSAASFGKGLRLEKAVILSLVLLYANIAILILRGNLTLTG